MFLAHQDLDKEWKGLMSPVFRTRGSEAGWVQAGVPAEDHSKMDYKLYSRVSQPRE